MLPVLQCQQKVQWHSTGGIMQ